MSKPFEMKVMERLVLAEQPGVVLAGPVLAGSCGVGEPLRLTGKVERDVTCIAVEMINWGHRDSWISVRVSDLNIGEAELVTTARSLDAVV